MKESTGERIKRLRLEKKMSVTEFAEKVGTSRMQIYRYDSDAIEKMPYGMDWLKPSILMMILTSLLSIFFKLISSCNFILPVGACKLQLLYR